MTYATVMVNLQLGRSNANLVQVAGDLAERFGSGVIGIAACQPMQIVYGDTYVPTNLIEEDRKQIDRELAAAEAEFRTALQGRISRLEWRSTVTVHSLSRYLARQARSADLLITGVDRGRIALRYDAAHRPRRSGDAGRSAGSRRSDGGQGQIRLRAGRLEGRTRKPPRRAECAAVPGQGGTGDGGRNRRRGGPGRGSYRRR